MIERERERFFNLHFFTTFCYRAKEEIPVFFFLSSKQETTKGDTFTLFFLSREKNKSKDKKKGAKFLHRSKACAFEIRIIRDS